MTSGNRILAVILVVALAAATVPWLVTLGAAVLTTSATSRAAAANQQEIVGDGIRRDVIAYVAEGIPLDRIVGLSEYLASDLAGDALVAAALVEDSDGRVLGRYFAEPFQSLALIRGFDEQAWRDQGVTARGFPVVFEGQVVGRVLLGTPMARSSALMGGAMLDFLIVFITTLLMGFQIILVAYRENIGVPQRALVALEGRVARHRFNSVIAAPDAGPLVGAVEAANRMVAAVNDRFVRARTYLAEVARDSFNPRAGEGARVLVERLDSAGRFARKGLSEVVIDHSDQFVGPCAFRAGAVLGALLSLALMLMPDVSGASSSGVWELGVAVGLGLLAALALETVPHRPLTMLMTGLALSVTVVLPELGAISPVVLAVLVGLAAGAVGVVARRIVSDRASARAGAAVHAVAGLATGAGVAGVAIGAAGPVAGVLTAVLALVPLLLLVLRHETPAAARSENIRLGLPLRHLETTVLAVLPAWTYFAAAGLFLGVHGGSAMQDVSRPAIALWSFGLIVTAGGVLMLFALHRWRILRLAEGAVPLVTVVLAAVAWTGAPGPEAMLIVGVALGFAAPAAAGLLGLSAGGSVILSASGALTAGLMLSWLASALAGGSSAVLLTALAAAGAAGALPRLRKPAPDGQSEGEQP